MASKLDWKVYRDGKLVAATRDAEDAAALVAMTGSGQIKSGGWVVWTEGKEGFPAGCSYDGAARIMQERVQAKRIAAYDRQHGAGAAAKVLTARPG